MKIKPTRLPGVLQLQPRSFGDERGSFSETWNDERMRAQGLDFDFVQDNQSISERAGTVRGLHFQAPPHAQAKLVRVTSGAILDVAVDIRRGSPYYGQWVSETLSAANGAQLLIPAGFLHGFITLVPDTVVVYKVDARYAPECEGSVRFDDPDLAIDWGTNTRNVVLSVKDAIAPAFHLLESPFRYLGGASGARVEKVGAL